MTLPDDDSLMLAYVYGELSDDEARAFEARLAGDPGLRAEVDGLVATRDLLKQDARFGEVSGADLPPPHLADAILRAEVLARPPEVRRAHAANGGGGFLARVQVWLVGGGLAVGAAAALLLVAKEGDMPEPELAAQAPAQEVAKVADEAALERDEPAAAVSAKAAEAPPAGEAQSAALVLDDERGERAPPAEEIEASAEPGTLRLEGNVAQRLANEPERKAAKEDEAPSRRDKEDRAARAGPDLDALGAGDGEAFGSDVPLLEQKPLRAKEERRSSSSDDALAAMPKPAEAEAPDDAALHDQGGLSTGAGLVGGVGGSSTRSPSPMAGTPSAQPTAAEPASPPVTAAPPGPPPLPEAAKREIAKKRAQRERAPAREKQKAKAAAPSKQQALADDLQMSLLTAERELESGRAQEALDLFTSVARRDPRGAFTGVVPYVGQMRALQALKRHREVLALLPTVKRPGIRAPGVAEGILVAARSAEALGDPRLARSLYRELLVVKERRKEAEAALERLDASPAVRSKAAIDSAADVPAAAAEE